LTEVISQIPSLEDHAEYQACVQKLEELERRLAEAKNELTSLGDGPILSEHDAEDLDAAVARHQEALETHERASMRAELKIGMLQKAVSQERAKVPALRKQAEDFVGQAGGQLHRKAVAELYALRDQMSAKLTEANAIRRKSDSKSINRRLGTWPGNGRNATRGVRKTAPYSPGLQASR
jgi:chromosome segregation ATPase